MLIPHSTSTKGDREAEVPSGSVNTDSSGVSGKRLVSRTPGSASRPSQGSSRSMGFIETAQVPNLPAEAKLPGLARVAIVERTLGEKEKVSARIARPNRESSLAVYESKWRIFSSWCRDRETNPLDATAPLIGDFLLEKHNKGLAPITLAGYRTAIARTIEINSGIDFGVNESLSVLLSH